MSFYYIPTTDVVVFLIMKQIDEWENLISDAVIKRFPESTQEERIAYIQEELNDIKIARLVEQGKLTSKDYKFDNVDERIGGLLANIFVLTKKRDINLDAILQKSLDWYLDPSKKPSSSTNWGRK
jgi:hypothetical protein